MRKRLYRYDENGIRVGVIHAVSFTKILTPFGRIYLEFVANDLPTNSQKKDSEKWG